jgi:hypothetical protein
MSGQIPNDLSAEDAKALLDEQIQAAYEAVAKAEAIADKYGLNFNFSVAYGMGGRYIGDQEQRTEYVDDDYYDADLGWRPSSHSC